VGDGHKGESALVPRLFQEGHDLVAGAFVEVPGGLIGEENSRFLDQGPRDGYPLLLAAGQLGGQVPGPVAQPGPGQRLRGALLRSPASTSSGTSAASTFSWADKVGMRLKVWKMKPIEVARTLVSRLSLRAVRDQVFPLAGSEDGRLP
jgi:hypothetical protein